MSLRTRIALIVSAVTLASTGALYAIQEGLLFGKFLELERREAAADLGRCEDAVKREIHHLAVGCGDWAAWDAAYQFVQDGNEAFLAENVTTEGMRNTRWNGVWFVAADGRVVHRKSLDSESGEEISFPEVPSESFPPDHPLLPRKALDQGVSGIVRTARGPLLVASRPIIRSDFTGPAAGWFVCGRLLTAEATAALAEQTRVDFRIWDVEDPAADPSALAAALGRAGAVHEDSDEVLHAAGALPDVFGRRAVVLRADVPRDISREGAQTMRVATAGMAIAGGGTVVVLLVLLSVTVVTPLRRLTEHATRIATSSDLSARSGISRSDEIGVLASEFDAMVAKLAESKAQFADAARRAGMADVARGVLHNVGNVLTSVNVSAGTIASGLRNSRAEGLLKAVDMVGERRADLAAFLTEDPRGRVLPEYLGRSAASVREERAALLAEAEKLQKALAHAAEVVARQGEFASGPAVTERVPLDAAVAGAVSLVEPAFQRHSIALARHADASSLVTVDRAKVTQVLVNLLTNAKEALAGRERSQRRVNLRAEVREGRFRITVEDNGCGIAPADLPHVFESGFSTKDGSSRGFGLHYCANAAREMGGDLRAASDGPGLGATFTLDIPSEPAAPKGAARAAPVPTGSPA